MRTLAIAKKVLRELLRDKRTLAMMFVAPVFIMWLVNIMFSANTTTNVTLATLNVDSALVQQMKDIDHVTIKEYQSLSHAEDDLKDEKIDGIIEEKAEQTFDITYANYDPTKTAISRQAFSAAMTKTSTQKLKDTVTEMAKNLATVKENMAKAAAASPNASPAATPSSTDNSLTSNAKTPTIQQHYIYGNEDTGFFSKMIPIMMGFVVFFFVFLISGMALLKERTSGTLDRLLATPVKRSEIVLGYMLSYGLVALVQTLVIVLTTIFLLDIEVVGSIMDVFLINILLALVALSFGFFLSTLAKSEFQMMQFIPVVVMPQMMFSGIIPLDSMASWVQGLAKILPLSYAGEAMTDVIVRGKGLETILPNLGILAAFVLVLTILNVEGLRRYRKV